MSTFFVCLLAGFLIVIPQSYGMGAFWLTVSCVTYIPVIFLPWYKSEMVVALLDDDGESLEVFADRYAKQQNTAIWLSIILPIYTLNYLLAFYGCYGLEATICIYQICSVLTKGLFAGCTMVGAYQYISLLLIFRKAKRGNSEVLNVSSSYDHK